MYRSLKIIGQRFWIKSIFHISMLNYRYLFCFDLLFFVFIVFKSVLMRSLWKSTMKNVFLKKCTEWDIFALDTRILVTRFVLNECVFKRFTVLLPWISIPLLSYEDFPKSVLASLRGVVQYLHQNSSYLIQSD